MKDRTLLPTSKIIALVLVAFLLASCQEEEFYEKRHLAGVGVDKDKDNFADEGHKSPNEEDTPNVPKSNEGSDKPQDESQETDGQVDQNNDQDPDVMPKQPDQTESDDSEDSQNQSEKEKQSEEEEEENRSDQTDDSDDPEQDNADSEGTDENAQAENQEDQDGDKDEDITENEQNDTQENQDQQNDEDQSSPLEKMTDTFQQNEKQQAKVDILWVVDDSGSMRDEQEALAYNFETFINDFLTKEVDFRMAITTTDPTRRIDGKTVCNWKLLTSEYAAKNPENFRRKFKSCIQVGTRGSGHEQGLNATESFLQRYRQDFRGKKEFLREDAYWSVVVVSDEEDQSANSVDYYLDRLRQTKRQDGLLKVYSIVTTEEKAEYNFSRRGYRGRRNLESIGHRYMKASNETAGKVASIKNDFHSILDDFGGTIVELTSSFALSQQPQGEVKVSVDGQNVESGWSYDAENRSIKFEQDALPEAGSHIEVTYTIESEQ